MLVRLTAVVMFPLIFSACTSSGPETTRVRATPTASPAPTPTATATPTLTDPFDLARSYEAPDPDALSERLADAERRIRDASTPPDEVAEAGRVQQAAYRQLVVRPEWRDAVYSLLPESLHEDARANVEAGEQLRRLTDPRESLPADRWLIVAPASSEELEAHYRAAGEEFGLDWTYLAAIHLTETRMGRIRGASTAGALGAMQFLPSTWEAYGEGDINSNRDSIRAAARYLVSHGAPGDMERALFAYNHSNLYVRAIVLYAGVMERDATAYRGYHAWEVYYRTTQGDALLPVGWPET